MKFAVIGGTGLIGSQVVRNLNAAGHEAVPHSLSTGVDVLTGQGVDAALAGADVEYTRPAGAATSSQRKTTAEDEGPMGIEHSHHLDNPDATTPPPKVELISSVPAPPVPDNAEAMTILVTVPPGSEGSPPHRHTGPAFGYVIRGEMIFELEGEPQRVVRAGETFWEPGGDVIHYQDGNNLPDAETVFVITMFGVAGQPMLIPVSAEELEERRERRAPRP
ncbi:cupin domain-containing protein [Streptosporangium roseum]|uniref:cupin domain-containing protein n=1 Tax=Streptosporangium roseum TaxID=2001 RepID=UPI000A997DFF|nr:cupin domain-containing protein [Streptosporangium roseum]